MSWFTKVLIGTVVCLFAAVAIFMAIGGAYQSALMSLGISVFFAGVGVTAWFEGKHLDANGPHRLTSPWDGLRRIWNIPGWLGKGIMIFCASIIGLGAVSKLLTLLLAGA